MLTDVGEVDKKIISGPKIEASLVDGSSFKAEVPPLESGKWQQLSDAELSYRPGSVHETDIQKLATLPVSLQLATNSCGWRTIGIGSAPEFVGRGGSVQVLKTMKDKNGMPVVNGENKPLFQWAEADKAEEGGIITFSNIYDPGMLWNKDLTSIPETRLGVVFRVAEPNSSSPSYFRIESSFSGSSAERPSNSYVKSSLVPLSVA